MHNDKELKNIAEKILSKANLDPEGKYGSVIAILMIISIVLTLIRVLQECNENKTQNMTLKNKSEVYGESIRLLSKKRGWFTRIRVKRVLKRELSPEEYNKYAIQLTQAILDVGQDLNDDEVRVLVEAANV